MMKTPVSLLQEFCARGQIIPQYDLVCNGVGTHNPYFEYRLTVEEVVSFGNGKSKKEAKHDAAKKAIDQLNIGFDKLKISKEMNQTHTLPGVAQEESSSKDVSSPYKDIVKHNSVGELLTICTNKTLPTPEYYLVGEMGPPHAKTFTFECCVSKYKERAESRTKQQAKHLSAIKMIERLKAVFGPALLDPDDNNQESPYTKIACDLFCEQKKIQKKKVWEENFSTAFSDFNIDLENICDVSALADFKNYIANTNTDDNSTDPCELLVRLFENSAKEIVFELLPNVTRVTYACRMDFSPYFVTLGAGPTEEEAKIQSARNMLKLLKDFL